MDKEKITSELSFKAVRSSGAGGQNVNKVSSKIILNFDLAASTALSDEEKALAEMNLASKLTNDNVLILQCDEDRSQLRNKEIVIKRFLNLMENALKVQKERKPTKVPYSVIKKRIHNKRNLSDKKQSRRKPDY
jgi:ribosome-associated protein